MHPSYPYRVIFKINWTVYPHWEQAGNDSTTNLGAETWRSDLDIIIGLIINHFGCLKTKPNITLSFLKVASVDWSSEYLLKWDFACYNKRKCLHALCPTKTGKSGFIVSPDGLWGFKIPLLTEKFQYKINNIMCMGVYLCVPMCTMCMPGIHRGNKPKNKNKKGVRSPGTVVTYNWEPPMWCWQSNPGPLQE